MITPEIFAQGVVGYLAAIQLSIHEAARRVVTPLHLLVAVQALALCLGLVREFRRGREARKPLVRIVQPNGVVIEVSR